MPFRTTLASQNVSSLRQYIYEQFSLHQQAGQAVQQEAMKRICKEQDFIVEVRQNKKFEALTSKVEGISHSVQKLVELKDSVDRLCLDSKNAATKADLDDLDLRLNSFALKTVF